MISKQTILQLLGPCLNTASRLPIDCTHPQPAQKRRSGGALPGVGAPVPRDAPPGGCGPHEAPCGPPPRHKLWQLDWPRSVVLLPRLKRGLISAQSMSQNDLKSRLQST